VITVRILSDISANMPLFELDAFTELADRNAKTVHNNLKAPALNTSAIVSGLTASNYPNPFNQQTTISYNLPENGHVQVVLYNKIGQAIKTLVNTNQPAGVHTIEFSDELMPGVYQYRIILKGETGDHSLTKSMIVVR